MGKFLNFFMSIGRWIVTWFVQNPHRLFWAVIIAIAALLLLGWIPTTITSYIVSTTVVLAITNAGDEWIFAPKGKGVKTIFSRNRFASRWDGFPMFLIEIFAIAWGGSVLNGWLENNLNKNPLPLLFLVAWMVGLIVYYWFVGSRDD